MSGYIEIPNISGVLTAMWDTDTMNGGQPITAEAEEVNRNAFVGPLTGSTLMSQDRSIGSGRGAMQCKRLDVGEKFKVILQGKLMGSDGETHDYQEVGSFEISDATRDLLYNFIIVRGMRYRAVLMMADGSSEPRVLVTVTG